MNNKTKLTVGAEVIAALLGTTAIVSISLGNGADDLAITETAETALSEPVGFSNCLALNQEFANGVTASAGFENLGEGPIENPVINPSVFADNAGLDSDRDGIACEVVIDPTQPQNWESLALPLETCQLKETKNFFGGGSKGFPAKRWNQAVGNVKIAIIPVDFSNAVGEGSPAELFKEDIRLIGEWAKHFSRGKLTYDIEFNAKSWIRAPKEAQWYTCAQCKGGFKELQPRNAGVQQMIAAADMAYDFEGVEIIYFIFPAQAEEEFGTTSYGFNEKFSSQDGPITASIYGEMGGVVGGRPADPSVWDHAVHEMLHFQGFVGHGPSNWTGHYISVDQWGPSKAVTSWEAFLNGWFDEEEILCLDKESLDQELFITMDSIDTFGDGKESVMVRLDDEELIVIERREPGPFTKMCSECNSSIETGFTAYRVNVNNPHYRDDSDPDSDQKNFWSFLGDNKKPKIDDSVEYQGVRITRISDKQMKLSLD